MQHALNKQPQTQSCLIFFFISKSAYVKKIRSVSKKDTNQFLIWEKFRSTSNEDADPFFVWEKFRSTPKKDTDLFLIEKKKFKSTSKKDVDPFLFKKNSNMHLRKMQICFYLRKIQICFCLRKSIDHMQIIGIKKEIVKIIKKNKIML